MDNHKETRVTEQAGAHHLTPDNIAAVIKDLREIEAGTTERPIEGRDWRTWAGVMARIVEHLSRQAAPEAPTDERRNIAEVKRTSDMGLSIRFLSARACSAFERHLAISAATTASASKCSCENVRPVLCRNAAGYQIEYCPECGKEWRVEEATTASASDGPCTVPPAGWSCTRTEGHDGPCAAIPGCRICGCLPCGCTGCAPAPSKEAAPLDIIERVYKEADAHSGDRIKRAAYFSRAIRAALAQRGAAQAPIDTEGKSDGEIYAEVSRRAEQIAQAAHAGVDTEQDVLIAARAWIVNNRPALTLSRKTTIDEYMGLLDKIDAAIAASQPQKGSEA